MGTVAPFLKLDDFLLPLPLPAVVAVLIVLGLAEIGARLAGRLPGPAPADRAERAAGFVVAAGLAGAIAHAIAWAGLGPAVSLRVLGWALAALGALRLPAAARTLRGALAAAREAFVEADVFDRAALAVAGLIVIGLALATLGPPTDSDSLDYHLGVPLDWLRHGAADPRPDWFYARLAGLGEAQNMVGLASGTDVLGAQLQLAGLLAALVAVQALARTRADRVFAALVVTTSPILLFLVPNQKPQLLPAAGTALALVLLARDRDTLSRRALVLALGCALFAVSAKHSFLLSAPLLLAVALWTARRQGRLGFALAVAAGFAAAFVLPVWWRNAVFYGNPISPLLESLRRSPDPAMVGFESYLRNAGDERSLGGLTAFLGNLVFDAAHPRDVTRVLGLGSLAFLVARETRGAPRLLLVSAALVTLLALLCGQWGERFFFEPYLWCAAAATGSRRVLPRLFPRALVAQGLLTAGMAAFAAVELGPGALRATLRDEVMRRHADGYAEARWLDGLLPPDAKLLVTVLRPAALLPRDFVRDDPVAFGPSTERSVPHLLRFARSHAATALVLGLPAYQSEGWRRCAACGTPLAPPAEFHRARRAPFPGAPYHSVLIALRLDDPICRRLLDASEPPAATGR